ncbi:hypothetical protein BDF20DRAFT_959906 [Mycotypha africana]|uniref:uncharacterized protein n=1 Tax=Mycotypha africana TaxID=64632 RepID=UPI002300110C|nr:uncharacterized protein BDF20DRAFT_959906 [Mycotypha africana]KAI8975574.1 hypothetical protein BDF20DRAFT_959906 [Mycotypha africana]
MNMLQKIIPVTLFSRNKKKKDKQEAYDDEDDDATNDGSQLKRTETSTSYMQSKRYIYVNMPLPASEYDSSGNQIHHNYASNRVRTAKYTPISFVPKNLFEQFRNVANLYFLFLVILQCIPLFGVTEPAVSALPLICILVITGIKDAIEDWKRNQSDIKVNNSEVLRLSNWKNLNVPEVKKGTWHFLHIIIGFFSVLSGSENRYAHIYRHSKPSYSVVIKSATPTTPTDKKGVSNQSFQTSFEDRRPLTEIEHLHENNSNSHGNSNNDNNDSSPRPATAKQSIMTSVRKRSNTIRSGVSSIFSRNNSSTAIQLTPRIRKPYRPGAIPHSVLYRTSTRDSNTATAPSNSSEQYPQDNQVNNTHLSYPLQPITSGRSVTNSMYTTITSPKTEENPITSSHVKWDTVKWKNLNVGDYVKLENNDNIPADIVILSTSETDNICYVETQNLDGETNLKQRQGLPGTAGIRNEFDCEQARFYIESEPPHVNIYQYNAVLRWQIVDEDEAEYTVQRRHSGVSHEKADAVTYNNILLRGCVLRNTKWAIGIVVYTGNDTKIMLNSGRTPSKRSKLAKATNPHVIANFGILAAICIISSIMDSVQFNNNGSSRYFDYGIEKASASYSGFVTFWVTLILYQNIVPISLYISVEIVKTLAAYFIFADLEMYHSQTDTPCIPKTWNISDDLGQIEYIFSDKTGTLTQNVMEFKKCTIDGVKYGLGTTEATHGALKSSGIFQNSELYTADQIEEFKDEMLNKQSQLFKNPYIGPNPTFVAPELFDDLCNAEKGDAKQQQQANAITHFFQSLALCHTVIAERLDEANKNHIEYKAQSPDEAALVATARDMGFVFLGRDSNKLYLSIKGEQKIFTLLNVLEFNSTRKRMSVIVKPADSDRIVLLCKGADSVIYERLCTEFGDQTDLKQAQDNLKSTTLQHLEQFANEGLRTLCIAYRFISEKEYRIWNKKYQEAAASIYNREERLDAVNEKIEQNMLLMGGTAIEDRLQEGVPETIAELAKSGIKLWVLTGDKSETAINIGFACNLLTTDMELLVLKSNNRVETAQLLKDTLRRIDKGEATMTDETSSRKYALVIDGTTLKYALQEATSDKLLAIGMRCASVICCRVSPMQKAQVVSLVKKKLKVMTLAIGDGANDVSMIQEANVGIGISGVEGRQAVMASDYAIAQFRFLKKLLLVHGRWSYLRISEMIMGFFFKNIVWSFVLFWYQCFCQFNGSMIYDYVLITLYNLVFTSLPIIAMAIWDQDLNASLSLKYPQLYRMGLRNDKFKVWRFWLTTLDSIYQSAVCFFFPYMLLKGGPIDSHGFDANGLYEIGTIISSISVCVANFFVATCLYSFTWLQVFIIAISILVYYVFVCIYSQFNTFIFAGHIRLFGSGAYWLMLMLTIITCFLPRMVANHYLHQYNPYDNDIIREIELVSKKKPSQRRSVTATYEDHERREGDFMDVDKELATEDVIQCQSSKHCETV